jgi:hypothetical protein
MESIMSMNAKKSMAGTLVLVVLGLLALFVGAKWLVALIPAALIVWFAGVPAMRSARK